tara:strand:+ start:1684 stop:2601 length:918 start_codon:yes stop_codon:yes gene_type:complete
MNLVLDFTACIADDCNSIQFCDTTCVYDPILPANCVNGYGYLDNPTKRDINYTRFNWLYPDGTVASDLDLSWKPGTKSFVEFQLTGGTNGIIIVDIEGLVLGSAVFITDIATSMDLLVLSINANSSITGWSAQIKEGTTDTITITQVNYGVEYNGLTTNVTLSGDLTVLLTQPLTAGGTDETNCLCITRENIYTASGSTAVVYNSFPDGVHTISYILYDSLSQEIARKTKKFLYTCHLINGIKELLISMADGSCACSHDEVDERIMKLRMMLEQAQVEFDECLFDCAQDTINKACKLFDRICTGC